MAIFTEDIVAGPYAGNGVTETFAFAFKVFVTSDVLVKHTSIAGVDRTAVLNTDYTVSLNADQDNNPGGEIQWKVSGSNAPLPSGEQVTITSDVPNTQGAELPSGGKYAAKTVERMIDKATILVKQFGRSVTRTLVAPITDGITLNELPNKTQRASKVLAFDTDGQPVAQAEVPTSGVLATAYMETLLDDVDAQGARQTLLLDTKGNDVVAAATLDLSNDTGDLIDVTGSTGITAITLDAGVEKTLRFAGAPLITHSASLVCPGNANIQVTAGDTCKVRGYAAGVVRIFSYQPFEQGVLSKLVTTKGDILVATAARTVARKAVGADNTILVADSAQTEGIKWAVLAASDTIPGLIELATQAEQETGTDTTRAVTPGRQHFHPSAAKAWGIAGVTGNLLAGYNISSVTDGGVGIATFNFTTSLSSANYAAVGGLAAANKAHNVDNLATGSVRSVSYDPTTGSGVDPTSHSIACFGDL